ncbi:cation transporter [Nonomuraea candida]|uniref:cation transporter n=1 Tax=Nonomuraea candida TaxID=359159 RepID=UPI0005B9213E
MTVATYQVEGMTCGHCVSAVTAEVGKVAGVSGVEVDLAAGAVTVTSAAPIDAALIDAAVVEAGYEPVGRVTPAGEAAPAGGIGPADGIELLPQAGGSSCCGSGACH